jgi:small-conductance mechanosensitive channel
MPRSDHGQMPTSLRYLFILLLALTCAGAAAQDISAPVPAPATPAQTLQQLRAQMDEIRAQVDSNKNDVPLSDLRSRALTLQQQSEDLAATLSPLQNDLKTRLAVLGPPPAKGTVEAPALAAQRRELDSDAGKLDAEAKQANSLAKEASQLAAHVAQLRRDKFQTRLASRTATPFSRTFWVNTATTLPDDMSRVGDMSSDVAKAFVRAWQDPNRTPLLLCLAIAAVLFTAGRWLIERMFLHITTNRMPAGRLRRSALVVAITLAYTAAIGLAAQMVYLAVNWNGLLNEDLEALAQKLVRVVAFAAFMIGLGRGMLSSKRPSWRLLELSDDTVAHLRAFPWLLGFAALALGTIEAVDDTIGAGLATTVALRAALAIGIGLLVGSGLIRTGRSRRATLAAGEIPAQRPIWVGLLIGTAFVCVGFVLLGVASGYIAFAFFIARQMLWVGVMLMTLYLLMHLADDIFETVFAPKGHTGLRMQNSFGLSASTLEQTGTLLSGITRAVLLILAAAFVLAPFGAGPDELAGRVSSLLSGHKLGNLAIEPSRILYAIFVFAMGLLVLHLLKRWLSERLLPKTSLDIGMQTSMLTLLGYAGGVFAFVLALATLKVDLRSIAWMASALSVGIGFGLQAIVQNFISGLILLAERPVKVGDWVSIGDVEGDIRRISVRATEIQMGDRSTMIVPNSQFITQNVRNVTLANAQGRVNIPISLPLDTDAGKARELILGVLREHPQVLPTPAPSVQLDNLAGGSMTFNCYAYVNSPRDVGKVKSDMLFELLQRLRAANLPLTSPQSMVVRNLPAARDDSVDTGG